ncbi:hypothetical protein [Lactovum miscens]|uniref:Uncharacterized protein n=1 Tax=Lactovum miscens TaxID=190387 RepID=A0A841C8Z4_9LACT|nr:hypothetical protein [Lactovum miscens]MBB5887859.1 hypothetical protein [Lactovum miscens]
MVTNLTTDRFSGAPISSYVWLLKLLFTMLSFTTAMNPYFAPILIMIEVFGFNFNPIYIANYNHSYLLNGNISIYAQEKLDENL